MMRVFRQEGKADPLEWRVYVDEFAIYTASGPAGGDLRLKAQPPSDQIPMLEQVERMISEHRKLGYVEIFEHTFNYTNPPREMRLATPRKITDHVNEVSRLILLDRALILKVPAGVDYLLFVDDEGLMELLTFSMKNVSQKLSYLLKRPWGLPPRSVVSVRLYGAKTKELSICDFEHAQDLLSNPLARPKVVITMIYKLDGEEPMRQSVEEWYPLLRNLERAPEETGHIEPGVMIWDREWMLREELYSFTRCPDLSGAWW
jgi:hypothetical protein